MSKRISIIVFAVVFSIAIITSVCLSAVALSKKFDDTALKGQIEDLQDELNSLKSGSTNIGLQNQINELLATIESLQEEIESLKSGIDIGLQSQIDALKTAVDKLKDNDVILLICKSKLIS